METIYTTLYLLKDSHGNKAYAIVEYPSDSVQVCGLKDASGNSMYFESEAYHLHSYFDAEAKVEIKTVKSEVPFDTVWDNN